MKFLARVGFVTSVISVSDCPFLNIPSLFFFIFVFSIQLIVYECYNLPRGAAIAQWIRPRLPSSRPGLWSHHTCFINVKFNLCFIICLFIVKGSKIDKRGRVWTINFSVFLPTASCIRSDHSVKWATTTAPLQAISLNELLLTGWSNKGKRRSQ